MSDEKFYFENMDIYKISISFIDRIYGLFEKMSFGAQKTIGDNLVRAAISIASNIAESSGRRMRKEKRHFFEIAQGSAFECIPSLTLLFKRQVLTEEEYEKLRIDCRTISKMLTNLIRRFS